MVGRRRTFGAFQGHALLLLAALALSCGDSPAAPEPASLAVTPSSVTLTSVGETAAFSASITDQHGAAFAGQVEWRTSHPAVFTVTTGGVVKAVGNGSGTLTASFQGLTATASVTVAQVPTALNLASGGEQAVPRGQALPAPVVVSVLDARGAPVPGTRVAFAPATGHGTVEPSTAASDSAGLAATMWTLGDTVGPQVLTATVGAGVSVQVGATALVPPNQAPVAVGSLADWALTARGSAATVDVADRFNDPDGDALTYVVQSSDAGIAATSASGAVVTVRPLAAGAATVTVTARDPDGLTAELSAQADVHEPDLAATVSRDSVALVPGASFEFEVEVRNGGEGRGSAATTTVAAYVSSDSVIETTDERVGESREVEALARDGLARTAAAFAADSAAAPWTVVWVGACVEAVEGETETGNNCSRAIKVTTVPAVRWSFVSSGGIESSSPSGDPRTVVKITIDAPDVDYAGAGWLPLRPDDPQAVANVLEMLEVKTVGNPDDSDYDLAAERWGGTDSCGPICDEQISIVSADSQTVVEVRPPGLKPGWVIPLFEAADLADPLPDWITGRRWFSRDWIYQAGDYALSLGGSSRAELSIDADESLACRADADKVAPPYDMVDDVLVWRGVPGDASRDRGSFLGKKADPNKTYVIDIGFMVTKDYWRVGWPEWLPEAVRHTTEIFQRSGVNVELRVPAIVRYQDYKHYNSCQADATVRLLRRVSWEVFADMQWPIIEHYGIDLFYKIMSLKRGEGICGEATQRFVGYSMEESRIIHSQGTVDPSCSSGVTPHLGGSMRFVSVETLAHEIGHNLGLAHNVEDFSAPFDFRRWWHPSAWGYVSEVAITGDTTAWYGTIMSVLTSPIPFFSSDRALPKTEVCNGDRARHDYATDIGFCPHVAHRLVGDSIRLGGKVAFFDEGHILVDASEVMQYTIEDMSKFGCRPGSCQ